MQIDVARKKRTNEKLMIMFLGQKSMQIYPADKNEHRKTL